ncbi:MAG TPA: glycosyltransferase [Acidobacteriaceae bacterium]|nr:glycosyltransferase [Acidobacteriaceae bacterium]
METYLHDLAIRQAEIASVHVVVANSAAQGDQEEREGVLVTRVARCGTIGSMPICPGLTKAIRRSPADLVHMHTPNPGAAFSFLRSGHRGKLVITHHADILGRKFLRKLSDGSVKKAMDRAEAIIVTSHRYLDSSAELAPFRDKCRVIPMGIDLKAHDDSVGADPKLPVESPVILAIGRLVPYKGFDVLIRAMQDVDAKLVLIGTGSLEVELRSLIESNGLNQKVTMLGRVDDLKPYFARASLFVMPSVTRAEAFGIVQLEAMAAGLPIINTNIDSAVPEVSVHDETGLTVAPGDVPALAEAIQRLLNRPDLREKYGRAGKERVLMAFTADRMVERTLLLYEEILGGKIHHTR